MKHKAALIIFAGFLMLCGIAAHGAEPYENLPWLAPRDGSLTLLGEAKIRGMAFSSRGDYLLTADEASCLTLRKVPTGEVAWQRRDMPEASPNPISALALSDDGRFAAVGFKNLEQVHIWDLREGGLYRTVGNFAVKELLFSPGGRWLVVRDICDYLTLYDLKKTSAVYQSLVQVGAFSFAGESNFVYTSGARIHHVSLFSAKGAARSRSASFFHGCTALSPSISGRRLKAFFRDEARRYLWRQFSWKGKYWNLDGEWYVEIPAHLRSHRVAVSRDCSMLGLYAGDSVVVLDSLKGKKILDLPLYARGIEMRRGLVAIAVADGVRQNIEFWSTGKKRRTGGFTASYGFSGPWPSFALSFEGTRLVRGWPMRPELEMWDTARKTHRLYPSALAGTLVLPLRSNAALEPGGSRLAVNAEEEVRLLDLEKGNVQALTRFPKEQGARRGVKALFSPKGTLLAAARADGIRVWNMKALDRKPMRLPPAGPVDIAFSSDEKCLSAADFHGSLSVTSFDWGTAASYEEKGRFLRAKLFLSRDGMYLGCVAFTPDDLGRCGLEVWKHETPLRLMWHLPIVPPHLFHASGAFTPDGRNVYAVLNYPSVDHGVHVVDVTTGKLQRIIQVPPMLGPNPPDAAVFWTAPVFASDSGRIVFPFPLTGTQYLMELPQR